MSQLTIQLDPVALREATAQAIMGTLTPEVRENLLRSAISNLLNKKTGEYGMGKTELEIAFDRATTEVARELVREYVKSDASFMEKLNALIRETADRILNMPVDKMAEKMADAFTSSMRRDY